MLAPLAIRLFAPAGVRGRCQKKKKPKQNVMHKDDATTFKYMHVIILAHIMTSIVHHVILVTSEHSSRLLILSYEHFITRASTTDYLLITPCYRFPAKR